MPPDTHPANTTPQPCSDPQTCQPPSQQKPATTPDHAEPSHPHNTHSPWQRTKHPVTRKPTRPPPPQRGNHLNKNRPTQSHDRNHQPATLPTQHHKTKPTTTLNHHAKNTHHANTTTTKPTTTSSTHTSKTQPQLTPPHQNATSGPNTAGTQHLPEIGDRLVYQLIHLYNAPLRSPVQHPAVPPNTTHRCTQSHHRTYSCTAPLRQHTHTHKPRNL